MDENHFSTFAGFLKDFGSSDVGGHEVGCELDALEFEMEDLRDGFDEERFRRGRALPVISICPPAKSAMRICSMNFFGRRWL